VASPPGSSTFDAVPFLPFGARTQIVKAFPLSPGGIRHFLFPDLLAQVERHQQLLSAGL
jgi:hypothetical protein